MYVPRQRYSLTMSFWVVPRSSARVDAVLLGVGHVEAEQPRRGGVDRHRRVHPPGRDAVEQRAHVAEVGDRHADLADLAARARIVGVVAGLGRQVEGDRQPGLALGQVGPVELVRGPRRRVARVRAHHPRLVTARTRRASHSRRHCYPPVASGATGCLRCAPPGRPARRRRRPPPAPQVLVAAMSMAPSEARWGVVHCTSSSSARSLASCSTRARRPPSTRRARCGTSTRRRRGRRSARRTGRRPARRHRVHASTLWVQPSSCSRA